MKKNTQFIILLTLFSCGINKDKVNLAMSSTENYYKLMESGSIKKIPSLFSDEFYKKNDTDALMAIVKDMQTSFGQVKSAQLVNSETSASVDNHKSETKVELTYHVIYSSGYIAKERFKFIIKKTFIGKIDGYSTTAWPNYNE